MLAVTRRLGIRLTIRIGLLCSLGGTSGYASEGHPPPAVEIYPQGGVIGQPRRVNEQQNNASDRHQGDWGRFNMGNGEFAGFGPVGVYGVAPWAEDWSRLRDSTQRHDIFDPVKFIALNDQKTIWVSFSGESRARYWYESHPRLGTVGHQGAGRLTTRNLLGADLHLGEYVRVFGQLNNGTAAGWRYYGYNATWRRHLGVEQLFLEVKGRIAGAHMGMMVGRQQFLDAPSWLIYNAETPNVPQTWNGIRGYALWNAFRLDAYNFISTQITNDHLMGGGFDYSTRLYGVNASVALPRFSVGAESVRSFFDIFWMGFRFNGAQARVMIPHGNVSGTQTRQNIGFRWYGNAPDFEYDLSGDYQTGRFYSSVHDGNRPISAYAGRAILGWRHSSSFLHPFIGAQAEIYSGAQSQRRHGIIGGFIAPFSPRNGTYDVSRTLTRSNLMSIGPVMSIAPRSYLTFRLRVPFLWRQRLNDGIYSSSGRYNFLSGAALHQAGRWVGCLTQASMIVQLTQHLNYEVDGGSIAMSKRMRQVGAKSGTFMLSTITFRF